MNKVILIGNLTRDPELEETRSGISYAKLSIAVNRNYTTEDGDRITDFFDFTVWRERAENCCRYLKKGSKVAVIGSIENRTWEDDNGDKHKVRESDRKIGVNAMYLSGACKAIGAVVEDRNNLAVLESSDNPIKAFLLRGKGEGFTIDQLILPIRMVEGV